MEGRRRLRFYINNFWALLLWYIPVVDNTPVDTASHCSQAEFAKQAGEGLSLATTRERMVHNFLIMSTSRLSSQWFV